MFILFVFLFFPSVGLHSNITKCQRRAGVLEPLYVSWSGGSWSCGRTLAELLQTLDFQ